MLFKKSVVLAAHNWKPMVKALVLQVFILALAVALCFLMFGGLVEEVLEAFSSFDFDTILKGIVSSVSNGDFDVEAFTDLVKDLLADAKAAVESIPNIWNRVEISYVVLVLLLVIYRLLISISDVTVGFQLQEFMTSNTQRPFSWYAVKKFGESIRFVTLQMLLALPLDIVIIFGSLGLALVFAIPLGQWALIPAGVVAVLMYAARQTYFAFWLPALVTGDMNVRKSLQQGLATIPGRFFHVYWKTLVLILVMLGISTVSVLFVTSPVLQLVLGSVPDLILFFLLKCINFVEYFEGQQSPYFYKRVDVEGTERYNKKHRKASAK